jgi:hypothetical protein
VRKFGHGECLEYVETRQNGNFLSGRDVRAVSRDYQETVGASEGSDVARTLPGQGVYVGCRKAPVEACRQEVGEAGLFLERFAEGSLEPREWARLSAAENVQRGNHEKLERNHGGDWVAGETKDQGVTAAAKDRGLSGADSDSVEEKLGAHAFENRFDEIVLAHGDTAGKDENVFTEALLDLGGQIIDTIEGVDQGNGLATSEPDLGSEGDGIAVADVEGVGCFGDRHDFVACGEDGDARSLVTAELGGADLRGDCQLGITEAQSWREGNIPGAGLTATRHDILAGLCGAIKGHVVTRSTSEFDHHDGVRAGWSGCAGHDLYAGAGSERD